MPEPCTERPPLRHQVDLPAGGESPKTQVQFACVECGHEENADLVGAMNILAAGHAVIACEGMAQQGHPVKQEPTKATTQELVLA